MENKEKRLNFIITEVLRSGYGIGLIYAGKLIITIGGGLIVAGWLTGRFAEKNINSLGGEDNTKDHQD
jgi:hypothetical protein